MTDTSEYGDIVGTVLDEWGRRRTDGLLEDGTRIILIAVGGQVHEIYVNAVSQSLAAPIYEAIYIILKDATAASKSLKTSETTFTISKGMLVNALAEVLVEVAVGIIEVFKEATVRASAVGTYEANFTLPLHAVMKAEALSASELTLNISPEATIHVQAEATVAKPGELKVTRLYLVIGDLAIQIQGG